MKETYPLKWPEGQPRTPIKDREERKAWKKTEHQIIDALDKQMKLFKVLADLGGTTC